MAFFFLKYLSSLPLPFWCISEFFSFCADGLCNCFGINLLARSERVKLDCNLDYSAIRWKERNMHEWIKLDVCVVGGFPLIELTSVIFQSH